MDERLERLINRRLDGELTDAEQVELDRWLLRDPAARQCLGEYERIDAWSKEALAEVLTPGTGRQSVSTSHGRDVRRHASSLRWLSWTVVAAAAVLAFAVLVPPATTPVPNAGSPAVHGPGLARPVSAMPVDFTLAPDQMAFPARPASMGIPTERMRYRAVDVLGIYDPQKQEILLLEWDRKKAAAKRVSYEY
jgi:anti-sigma factor RsiW